MRRRFLITLMLAMSLAGHAAAADTSAIHRIAVIAALGRSATYYDNASFSTDGTIDLMPLKLDEAVVQDVAALIKTRFTIVPATYDHSAYTVLQTGFWGPKAPITDLIAARTDRKSVDAYLVIYPVAGSWISFETGGFRGAGLVRRSKTEVMDCAFYRLMLVDSATAEPLAETWLSFEPGAANPVSTWRAAPEDAAPDVYAAMTEAQREAFRQRLKLLVEASLKPSLSALGLL